MIDRKTRMYSKSVTPAIESRCYTASSYRKIMDQHGLVMSYTRGVSMRPLIFAEICYVAIVPAAEPQIGDLLLFEQIRRGSTACILHRLVAIDGDAYVTRGDNCDGCERISRRDIIGKVENVYWTLRKGKSWRLWLPRMCGAKREGGCLVLNVRDRGYLRYSKFWKATWPVRYAGYKLRRAASKAYRLIKKRK